MDDNNLFDDFKPGDKHIIKPVTPPPMYDCRYCNILDSKQGGQILEQNEKAAVITDDAEIEFQDSVWVVTKQHFMDLSSVDSEDLLCASDLAQKYSNVMKNKFPNVKGFRYSCLQGTESGQTVLHFSIRITPVNK